MVILHNLTLGFTLTKLIMNDMYLVLPSNACASTQPDNTASKYIINWHNPITLDGNWKAALVEFNCTYSPCTLKKVLELNRCLREQYIMI